MNMLGGQRLRKAAVWIVAAFSLVVTGILAGCAAGAPSTSLTPPPALNAIFPTSGFTPGGASVTILGNNLQSGTTVTFGGTAATSVTFTSSLQMVATAPAHASGKADVVVTNPDGQTSTLSGAFTYIPAAATPIGANVTVVPPDEITQATPASVTFSSVTQTGVTTLNAEVSCPALPPSYTPGSPATCYDLGTTALYSAPVTVTINFSGTTFPNPAAARLLHYEATGWVDRTTALNTTTMVITGVASSLSPWEVVQGGLPVVSLSTTSLAFGNQLDDTTSTPLSVTLTNTGTGSLSVSATGIAITGTNAGDFAQTNTCTGTIAAGANCAIVVLFTPSAGGTRTASLSITDNASNSPQTVSLTGTGIHWVALSWTPSTSTGVTSYNIYRSTTSGSFSTTPTYTVDAATACTSGTCTFADTTNVVAGQTYYYVGTAVASGVESVASPQAQATVSSP